MKHAIGLDQLVLRIGLGVVMCLFLPLGIYSVHRARSAANEFLTARARTIGQIVSSQVVEPLLLEDHIGLREALRRPAEVDHDVAYLALEGAHGRILAHTFGVSGYPSQLPAVWVTSESDVVRFRCQEGALMDLRVPIWGGELGSLHIGMRRTASAAAATRALWLLLLGMAMAIGCLVIGVAVLARAVSRPLRELETAVSQFPAQPFLALQPARLATREVASLAARFAEMIRRLEDLEKDRHATVRRMVHTERLAAVGELAAGLAHEIHNPLDGMLECVQYLEKDDAKSERAIRYYPMLRDGLHRVRNTMHELLQLAASRHEVNLASCPVPDIIKSLSLLVAAQLGERNVDLTWNAGGTCVCRCDPDILAQAGLNLILNAAEAAQSAPDPRVRVSATCDADWVYVSVDDNGPGVPDDVRSRVFDPFFTTKPPGKGTGLGLSVARERMLAAGGDLILEPEPSDLGGARFVIRAPKIQCGATSE